MTCEPDHSSSLAARVRARRIALGLSYGDLALRLQSRGISLSRQALSLWERGKRRCSFSEEELRLLADALSCDTQELAFDSEFPSGAG